MKLASFIHRGTASIGIAVSNTSLLDLRSAWPDRDDAPVTMIDFIERGAEGLQIAADIRDTISST